MDITQLIAARTARRDGLQARYDALGTEGQAILDTAAAEDKRALTDQEDARSMAIVEERGSLRTQIADFDAQLDKLRSEQADDKRMTEGAIEQRAGAAAPEGGTQHGRTQPRDSTYSRSTSSQGVSFFRDMYASQTGAANRFIQERLQTHDNEIRSLVSEGKLSERAIATGALGGLVPPQYLVEDYAEIARAGRPVANIVQHRPLPATGMTLTIPRGTTGVATGVQATQNTNVTEQDPAVTDLTIPVVTVAGQVNPSRQSIERGVDVDEILWNDLAAAYAVSVDVEVISGTGTGGRALGILNTGGITQMSPYTAAVTMPTFYGKVAGAINAVQTGRFLPPTAIAMNPRRWAWLTAQLDSSNRPLVLPTSNGPMNVIGVTNSDLPSVTTVTPSGELQALPVITDASIPTNLGTGPEDPTIVARFSDHLLWEDGDGSPKRLQFEQTNGGALQLKLVAYGYIAFTAARYPAATAIVGGNAGTAGFGQIAPTF